MGDILGVPVWSDGKLRTLKLPTDGDGTLPDLLDAIHQELLNNEVYLKNSIAGESFFDRSVGGVITPVVPTDSLFMGGDLRTGGSVTDGTNASTPAAIKSSINASHTHPVTKVLYVDGNRGDSYTETGSFDKPYKTIQAAEAVADASTIIEVAQGTYTGALTLTNAFAVWGKGWPTISGATAISGNHKDLRNLKIDGVFTMNTDAELNEVDCYGGIIDAVANPNAASTLIHGTFTAGSGVKPIAKTGTQTLMLSNSQVIGVGDIPSIDHDAGRLVLNSTGVLGSRAVGALVESSGGVVTVEGYQVVNSGGGVAMDLQNGAGAANPNALMDVLATGNVVCGVANTVVEGMKFLGFGALSGSALIFRPATHVANDSGVSGTTVADALNTQKGITDTVNQGGATGSRPGTPTAYQSYFDTGLTPARPIWWTGAAWVDAAGTGV